MRRFVRIYGKHKTENRGCTGHLIVDEDNVAGKILNKNYNETGGLETVLARLASEPNFMPKEYIFTNSIENIAPLRSFHRFVHRDFISLDPDVMGVLEPQNDTVYLKNSLRRLEILQSDCLNIFRYIYPSEESLDAFGDKISQLLILACLEVEGHFNNILRHNGCKCDKPTMYHFKKLAPILPLSGISLQIQSLPEIDLRTPFAGFGERKLDWWQAYTKCKHDIMDVSAGKLRHALDALFAVEILIAAQFGKRRGQSSFSTRFFFPGVDGETYIDDRSEAEILRGDGTESEYLGWHHVNHPDIAKIK